MTEIALYGRQDGLLEPRTDKGIEFSKANAGKLVIADVSMDTRSSLQNRYLNGYVYTRQICKKLNDAGILLHGMPWTRDTLHACFQDCFLVKYEFEFGGDTRKVYESTASMTRKRFTEYIEEQIKPFVWDMWMITIDPPNQDDKFWMEVLAEINR